MIFAFEVHKLKKCNFFRVKNTCLYVKHSFSAHFRVIPNLLQYSMFVYSAVHRQPLHSLILKKIFMAIMSEKMYIPSSILFPQLLILSGQNSFVERVLSFKYM